MIVRTLKQFKKILVAIAGFTVLIIGLLMIFTPGPSVLVIPFGLSILATEFIWAKKMFEKFKATVQNIRNNGIKN